MDLSSMLVEHANRGGSLTGPGNGSGNHQLGEYKSNIHDSGIGSQNGSPESATGHDHRRLPGVSQLDLPASPGGPGIAHLHKASMSPTLSNADPKEVTFVHINEDGLRGRIPFRVNITPSDSVDDIISTVKNFFGIYNGGSIGFEDSKGKMFIPRYENFTIGGTAFVRGTSFPAGDPDRFTPAGSATQSPVKNPFPMLPPASNQPLRPAFGAMSPPPTFRRGTSASGTRSKGTTPTPFQGGPIKTEDSGDDSDAASGKSSRRGVLSADVSLDNIVEGSRRKRAKFDSSELPLFVPPQVPAQGSMSSVSPQRQGDRSSIAFSNQRTFSFTNPLPSPGSFTNGYGIALSYPHPSGRGNRRILPTPDHTTASAMSDEDVAYQLMRLGDPSNFSNQGRTSTSTINDAWSNKVADDSSVDENYSSEEDEEDDEESLPTRQPMEIDSGEEYDEPKDESFKGESDGIKDDPSARRKSISKPATVRKNSSQSKIPKPAKLVDKTRAPIPGSKLKSKSSSSKILPSPTSLPTQSRKASVASAGGVPPLGPDEQDLSSRPRCQRCRKSKKGCDRQRPCGRCKDAGLGVDDCISEDEGNGRKGRFGRYMGVPVKKDASANSAQLPVTPQAPILGVNSIHPTIEDHGDHFHIGGDAGKKRKR